MPLGQEDEGTFLLGPFRSRQPRERVALRCTPRVQRREQVKDGRHAVEGCTFGARPASPRSHPQGAEDAIHAGIDRDRPQGRLRG